MPNASGQPLASRFLGCGVPGLGWGKTAFVESPYYLQYLLAKTGSVGPRLVNHQEEGGRRVEKQ